MTLTTRLFRLFSLAGNPVRPGRARVPRLESLRLSDHDLNDLNLPSSYRARIEADRVLLVPDRYR